MRTRKLLPLLGLLSLALPLFAQTAPPNLLPNGSFEFWSRYAPERLAHLRQYGPQVEGEDPSLPVRWNWATDRGAKLAPSPDAHGGKAALALSAAKGAAPASLMMDFIEVAPGGTYEFGAWVKGSGGLTITVQGQAIEGLQALAQASGEAGLEWQHVTGKVEIPGHIRLVRFTLQARPGAELLLDDAHFGAPLNQPYDPDAVLSQKPARDEHTLLFADFDADQPDLKTGAKNRLTDAGGGRFGRGLRLQKPENATLTWKIAHMPPEGTIECWLSPDAMPMLAKETWETIYHFLEVRSPTLDLATLQADTSVSLRWTWRIAEALYGKQNSLVAPSAISLARMRRGQWTHVAIQWAPDAVRLYVDGALAAKQTEPPLGWWDTPVNITIGSVHSCYGWDGVIDELRVSDIQRYGPFAPKGMKLEAPAPVAAVAQAAEATERPVPKLDVPALRKAMVGPWPAPGPNDVALEATEAKPFVTGAKFGLGGTQAPAPPTVSVGFSGYLIGDPWNEGLVWKLAGSGTNPPTRGVAPGKYWLGVVYESNLKDIEAPQNWWGRLGVYVNGRVVQCATTSNPVQVAPGVWFVETQAAGAETLKPGDEITVMPQVGQTLRVARLVLHRDEPVRGAWRVGTQWGGNWWNLYSSLRVNVQTRFLQADGKPAPSGNIWWGQEQQLPSPQDLKRDAQGRALAEALLANPLPVPVTVDYRCEVRGYYRQLAGEDKARVTLQPHERMTREVPFATTPDDPGYTISASFTAVNPPPLDRPETETITFFPGLRQKLPWPETLSGKHGRRLYFLDPVAGERCVLRLDGRWEMAFTTSLNPPATPPADAKFQPRDVPFSYWMVKFDKIEPRPHGAYLRRTFELPANLGNRSARLVIAEVCDEATAYVNGQLVGNVRGGNTPLVADATAALRPGTNEIIVVVRDLLAIMDPDYVNKDNPTPSALYLDAPGLFGSGGVAMSNVSLEIAPRVAAEDVLAIPSVRKGALGAKFTLANHTTAPLQATVKATVLDEGRPVFELGTQEVDLKAGESAPLIFDKPWAKPRLWSPDDPHLYVLAIETTDRATGKRLDLARERFGFRESWIAGNQIMLNGLPVKLKGTSTPYGFGADCGFQLTRGAPCPDWMDEFGWPASQPITGVFNSSSKHNVERDVFWQAAQGNMLAAARRDLNHPCILAWDLSNEWLCFLDYGGGSGDLGARRLRGLSEALWKLDPTRWTFYNGDEDLNGLHDNVSLHYALEATHPHPVMGFGLNGHSVFFPDGAFFRPLDRLFTPGEEIMVNSHRNVKIRWGEKVVMNTENLWKVGGYMPPGLTKFTGEEDVLSPAVDSGSGPVAWMWKQNLDGHRDLGCNSVSFYGSVPGTWRGGWVHQTFIMPDTVHHAFGGRTISRDYSLHNDVFHAATLALKWRLLGPDGKPVAQGQDVRKMLSGDLQRGKLTLKLPPVTQRTTYTLDLRLEADGQFAYGEERDVELWSAGLQARTPGVSCHVYDPPGKTLAVLKQAGVTAQKLDSLATPTDANSLLVIGEDTLDEATAPQCAALGDFVSKGGRVLILAQTVTPGGLPAKTRLEPREWSSMPFVRVPNHPVCQGVSSWDLHFWAPDRVSARGAYAKPEGGPAVPLVDSGTDIGLEWVQLMEMHRGVGRYLLCQLPVVAASGEEPMAREMLARMLAYMTSDMPYEKPTQRLQAVVPPDSKIEAQLRELNAAYTPTLPETRLASDGVALIDAGVAATDTQRTAWAQALKEGATVVVCGAQPDDAPWLSQLAGVPVSITVPPYRMWEGRAYRARVEPVTAGISQCDLYWRDYRTEESAGCQAEDPSTTIEPLQNFAVSVAGAKELVFPGALVELQVGQGRLLLDQRRWWTRHEKLTRYSTRLASALLLGLGVELEPVVPMRALPKGIAYQPLDLTSLCNRALADETPDDGQGGWSDQGPTADLRTFPTGRQSFQGVPFSIGAPPRCCLVLKSALRPRQEGMPQEVTIPLGYKIEGLYFLHTSTYTGPGLAAAYDIQYADGTSFSIPLKTEENIRDWISPPGPFPREKGTVTNVAWTGSTPLFKLVAVYRMLWVNPRPETPVAAVRFANPAGQAQPILLGLTAMTSGGAPQVAVETAKAQDLLKQGLAAAQQGDARQAQELFRQALAADASLGAAHQALAESLERAGDTQAASEAYRAWIAAGARTPLPYNRLGQILEQRRDHRGALDAYTQSLKLEWNQPPIIEAKARVEKALRGE